MATQAKQVGPSTKQGLIILAIILLIGLAIVVWISSISGWSTSSEDRENANIAAITSCLNTATESIQSQWPEGETKNLNEGHQLNMDYLNAQIDCYTPYNQDGEYDEYVDRIKERKDDELSTYQTQSQTASSSQSERITCTSSAIGSTAFTNCY